MKTSGNSEEAIILETLIQVILDSPVINIDSVWLAVCIVFCGLILFSYGIFAIVNYVALPKVIGFITGLNLSWFADIESSVQRLSHWLVWLFPCLFALVMIKWLFPSEFVLYQILQKGLLVYLYLNITVIMVILLHICGCFYEQQEYAKNRPLKALVQICQLLLCLILVVLVVSEFMGKSPLYLLSSLGAVTALLVLLFKDTILGIVASIQIVSHRLVAHGDWIEMDKFGADGEVLEVGLHTVKVRNWDNTITNIPTTAMINAAFKNWRGMSDGAGRRIKRYILIDIHSIFALEPQLLQEIMASLPASFVVDQQQLPSTNLELFRAYCEYYLGQHPDINQEMTLMARQLQPTEYGIPLELYCFSLNKQWIPYEKTQAQLIEYLLCQLAVFQLRTYQRSALLD